MSAPYVVICFDYQQGRWRSLAGGRTFAEAVGAWEALRRVRSWCHGWAVVGPPPKGESADGNPLRRRRTCISVLDNPHHAKCNQL